MTQLTNEDSTVLKLFKSSLFFLFIINLTACSYSPDSLKDSYRELESEISMGLQAPYDLSDKQRGMINDYSKQFFKWHRHNKLPAYSQNFAILAEQTQQQNPYLPTLIKVLADFEKIPHITQATHLTPKIVAFAKSLNNEQVKQLEQFLNDENRAGALEIKRVSYAADIHDSFKTLFQFFKVPLNAKQLKIVNTYAKQFHDTRYDELHAEKIWSQKVVSLLRQKNQPDSSARLASLWNTQDSFLTGEALQKQKQNIILEAKLVKSLILSFTPEQQNQLSKQLLSVSNTLSEMANEK